MTAAIIHAYNLHAVFISFISFNLITRESIIYARSSRTVCRDIDGNNSRSRNLKTAARRKIHRFVETRRGDFGPFIDSRRTANTRGVRRREKDGGRRVIFEGRSAALCSRWLH